MAWGRQMSFRDVPLTPLASISCLGASQEVRRKRRNSSNPRIMAEEKDAILKLAAIGAPHLEICRQLHLSRSTVARTLRVAKGLSERNDL